MQQDPIQTQINALIQWVSTNFELMMLIVIGWFILVIVIVILVRLDDVTISGIQRLGQLTIYFIAIGGQIVLLLLAGYIYWINYERKNPVELAERILPGADWVDGRFKIYYIEGNKLNTIRTDNSHKVTVLELDSPIRDYQFSPNGKYIAVTTEKALYIAQRPTYDYEIVDSIGELNGKEDVKGIIRGVSWSPDSTRIAYEISKWSGISSILAYKIYNRKINQHSQIKETLRQIPQLIWGKQADKLYFIHAEAMDTEFYSHKFEIRVFEIPLSTLKPQVVVRVPSDDPEVSPENLALRGVYLFDPDRRFHYSRSVQRKYSWVSETGSRLGIDRAEHLFYVKNRWWRKRLFKVPRERIEDDYRYSVGPYTIQDVRWIPGGRYVLMNHIHEGVLILEPATGRIGRLTHADGHAFGWYDISNE